jgi:hypothetical protein
MSVMAAALERMGMGIIPIMLMNRNGTVPVYARTPHVKFVLHFDRLFAGFEVPLPHNSV